MIVDDVPENRAVLARRLQRRGFDVLEANGGFRALELIREQRFDLILLDWMMPDLSGLEVLRRVRQKHTAASLPVIMLTAKTTAEDVVEAIVLGANDYLTKPVNLPVALASINVQIAREK